MDMVKTMDVVDLARELGKALQADERYEREREREADSHPDSIKRTRNDTVLAGKCLSTSQNNAVNHD